MQVKMQERGAARRPVVRTPQADARRRLVVAAFRAAALRDARVRRLAAERACLASAGLLAAARPSRFSRRSIACDRRREGFVRLRPARDAVLALRLVAALAFLGVPSFTPARRAFDNPIAIACFVDRAPCLPSRM